MIRKIALFSLFFLVAVFGPISIYAEEVPRPSGWVNDYAGVISQEYRDKMTALIEELRAKTTAEIFVITIQSIAPYDEKSYARLIFDSWKPGKAGKDNGVVVLVAIKERRWRIETGYGVEGILPDGLLGEIGRNYMVPAFKSASYGNGLYLGVIEIARIIAKDYNVSISSLADIEPVAQDSADFWIPLAVFLIIVIWIVVIASTRARSGNGRQGSSWGSGGLGGGGFGGGGFGGGGGGSGGGGGAGGKF